MERTITVKGTGSATARPDLVEIKLTLDSQHMNYEKTMAEAAQQHDAIVAYLNPCGIMKSDIKTASFNVDTHYEREETSRGNYKSVFRGYNCEQELTFTFDLDKKHLAQVLSALSDCSAKPEFSIRFTVKDNTALKNEALISATKDARAKAELLAKASGTTLGDLVSIDYFWKDINIYSDSLCDAMPIGCSQAVDIEPDDVAINDAVTFIWSIG